MLIRKKRKNIKKTTILHFYVTLRPRIVIIQQGKFSKRILKQYQTNMAAPCIQPTFLSKGYISKLYLFLGVEARNVKAVQRINLSSKVTKSTFKGNFDIFWIYCPFY